MQARNLFFVLALAVFVGIGVMCSQQIRSVQGSNVLHLKSGDVSLIVSDSKGTREKGLSGTSSLPPDTAMLFVFDEADRYGIWMKDMKYPIDIIWLDQNRTIVHLESNVSPQTFPKVFYPPVNNLYILETVSGFVQKNALKIGDVLDF